MCERDRNLRAEARRAADKSLISAGDECRGGSHSGQSEQNKVEVLKHWIMTSSDSVHFLDVATTRFSHLRRYVLQTSDRYRHTMHWGEERQWVCTVCNVSAGHNVARWAGKCPLCGSDGWCSVFTLYTSHRPQQPQVRGWAIGNLFLVNFSPKWGAWPNYKCNATLSKCRCDSFKVSLWHSQVSRWRFNGTRKVGSYYIV